MPKEKKKSFSFLINCPFIFLILHKKKMSKKISMIVAIDQKNGIGLNNSLLTHISNDLKRFKKITSGHTVIMGRNTWESLPKKPLPDRKNIVLTRNKNLNFEGAVTLSSKEDVLELIAENEEVFVIGGADIYKLFFSETSKLYLTKIHKIFAADAFFPPIDKDDWEVIEEEKITNDELVDFNYSFIDLERKV